MNRVKLAERVVRVLVLMVLVVSTFLFEGTAEASGGIQALKYEGKECPKNTGFDLMTEDSCSLPISTVKQQINLFNDSTGYEKTLII